MESRTTATQIPWHQQIFTFLLPKGAQHEAGFMDTIKENF